MAKPLPLARTLAIEKAKEERTYILVMCLYRSAIITNQKSTSRKRA